MTTIYFVKIATEAAEEGSGKYLFSLREIMYDRAYQRRLRREIGAKGLHAPASQALIALSGRMITMFTV